MAALAASLSQLGCEDADAYEDESDLIKTRGWLLKKGSGEGTLFSRRNWQKRYYVLDEDAAVLSYYSDDKCKNKKGAWKLTEATAVTEPAGEAKAFRGSGRRDSKKGVEMFYMEVHPVLEEKTSYFKHRPLELRAADADDLRGWRLGLERTVERYGKRGRARTAASSPADDLEKLHAQLGDAVELCLDVEAAMVAPPVTRPSKAWMLETLESIEKARVVVDDAALAGSGAFRALILREADSNFTVKDRLEALKSANENLRERVARARSTLGAALEKAEPIKKKPPPPPPRKPPPPPPPPRP